MADDDFFGSKPDVTKELIKTKVSNNSTRREYLRMKSEQALAEMQASSMHSIPEEATERKTSLVTQKEIIKMQPEEPEVTSFPFVDSVDGVTYKSNKPDKATDAKEQLGHKHGAKLCMLSAMVQMKVLASRRAKTIRQLRKNPRTTLDDKNANKDDSDDDDDDEQDGPLGYLKNCRYLRGVQEDKELSIEDIFG